VNEEQARDPVAIRRVAPTQNGGGVINVVRQMRAERVRLGLMRLSFALIFVLAALSLVWLMPWFPLGLNWDNYSGSSAGIVVLLALTTITSVTFVVIWGPSFRNEPLPEFLRVLFGGHQLIRGRHQFYGRLAAECRRARRDRRYLFSLVMVQRDTTPEQHHWLEPARDQDVAAMLVRGIVRGEDVVATSPGAIWLLVAGAGEEQRERVVDRLAHAIAEFDEPLDITGARAIGSASFGPDGDSPELLLFACRQHMRALSDLWALEQMERHDRTAV